MAAFEYVGWSSLATLTKNDAITRGVDIVFASGKEAADLAGSGFSYGETICGGLVWFSSLRFRTPGGSIGRAAFHIEGQSYPTYVFLGWS
jgi:hypothetical protein